MEVITSFHHCGNNLTMSSNLGKQLEDVLTAGHIKESEIRNEQTIRSGGICQLLDSQIYNSKQSHT